MSVPTLTRIFSVLEALPNGPGMNISGYEAAENRKRPSVVAKLLRKEPQLKVAPCALKAGSRSGGNKTNPNKEAWPAPESRS
jgi:hypothetical protein